MGSSLEARVRELEARVAELEAAQGERSHNASVQWVANRVPGRRRYSAPANTPWTSKSVQLHAAITQYDYAVTAQVKHAMVFAASGSATGMLAWAWQPNLWYAPIVGGIGMGLVSLTWMVVDHRLMVRSLVKNAVSPQRPQRDELRVEVVHDGNAQLGAGMEFLLVQGRVTRDNLIEFAGAALAGRSLAVNLWAGKLDWSRPAYEALVNELERRGFLAPARGNVGRKPTAKGVALFRGLLDQKQQNY